MMFRARSVLRCGRDLSWQALKFSLALGMTLNFAGCVGGPMEGDEPIDTESEALKAIDSDLQPIEPNLRPIDDRFDPDRPLPPPPPPPPPRPSLNSIMSQFSNYDMNGDGRVEINSLKHAFVNPQAYSAQPKGMVVVFVDPRLVKDNPNSSISGFEMQLWLSFYSTDLWQDGYFPFFVEADVYSGPVHQDGRTLLAMRRFLQKVRSHYPVTGTLLIGSFPEAGIVRKVFMKQHADSHEFKHGTPKTATNVDYLAWHSEYITPRAEIVLGDLDGNWEALYREAPFTTTSYDILPNFPNLPWPFPKPNFPVNGQTITTPYFNAVSATYEDVFFIEEGQVSASTNNGQVTLNIQSTEEANPETTTADRAQPNRIARPEIGVSRINARHVAIVPTTSRLDVDGKGPLAADGKPQALRFTSQQRIIWKRDATLERKLITDYISRAHRFRLGYDNNKPFRTSAIREHNSGLKDPNSFNQLLRRAADGFATSISKDNANLLDYVNWLKAPAVLRGIASHSSDILSQFPAPASIAELEAALGFRPWNWKSRRDGSNWLLEPSLEGLQGDARFHHYRTMFENKVLADAGQMFIIHDGCDVAKPSNYQTSPYNSDKYGQANDEGNVQNGESLMFYANGLALMSRNKVFNDTPAGFTEAVKATGQFGLGWNAYFRTDGANTSLDERAVEYGPARRERTLQRKRSYFWSVIGDFTLKIRYP